MKLRLKTRLNKANKNLKKLYKKAETVLFKTLPKSVGTPLAAFLIVAPILLAIYTYFVGSNQHPSSVTVMITTLDGRGGGSGVIIQNSTSESVILTNNHVCEGVLVKEGGKVRLVNGEEHLVTGILSSLEHDLCMITVAVDLKKSVELSSKAPSLYEEATITGHPSLMPNVITKGHFGGREIIPVMTGTRECTEKDLKNPELAPMCHFFGVAPIITVYESQIVTATIMAGSSGSAVLNSSGELSGLVFAGNADGLSYAYIVPYEAVKNFVDMDLKNINELKVRPWENADQESDETAYEDIYQEIKNKCSSESKDKTIKKFCQEVIR